MSLAPGSRRASAAGLEVSAGLLVRGFHDDSVLTGGSDGACDSSTRSQRELPLVGRRTAAFLPPRPAVGSAFTLGLRVTITGSAFTFAGAPGEFGSGDVKPSGSGSSEAWGNGGGESSGSGGGESSHARCGAVGGSSGGEPCKEPCRCGGARAALACPDSAAWKGGVLADGVGSCWESRRDSEVEGDSEL
eukprot:scaffold1182_cov124-Isochrysis_galbana.AAC.4